MTQWMPDGITILLLDVVLNGLLKYLAPRIFEVFSWTKKQTKIFCTETGIFAVASEIGQIIKIMAHYYGY